MPSNFRGQVFGEVVLQGDAALEPVSDSLGFLQTAMIFHCKSTLMDAYGRGSFQPKAGGGGGGRGVAPLESKGVPILHVLLLRFLFFLGSSGLGVEAWNVFGHLI